LAPELAPNTEGQDVIDGDDSADPILENRSEPRYWGYDGIKEDIG
jgi:hypothetical protein